MTMLFQFHSFILKHFFRFKCVSTIVNNFGRNCSQKILDAVILRFFTFPFAINAKITLHRKKGSVSVVVFLSFLRLNISLFDSFSRIKFSFYLIHFIPLRCYFFTGKSFRTKLFAWPMKFFGNVFFWFCHKFLQNIFDEQNLENWRKNLLWTISQPTKYSAN